MTREDRATRSGEMVPLMSAHTIAGECGGHRMSPGLHSERSVGQGPRLKMDQFKIRIES